MAQSITLWDRTTPLNNGNADSGINWLENQAPSTVNNSARAMMERLAEFYYDDGAVNTVAGTGDAITVTVNDGLTAYITGHHFRFVASAANTTAVTLNVNAIGAKAVRKTSGGTDVALVAGDLVAGETYLVVYRSAANAAAGAWVLLGAASVAAASTTQAGIVELATNAETIAGTSSTLVPTVNNLYFPTGYISGFLMTPDADASNDFSMAVGSARSSDDTTNIVLGSALIKQVDATWVVGTNQGGRFYTTLVAGSQVYAYIIKDPVNNLIDWGYSDNATNPTGGASYPAAYTKYTRVAGFWRSAGSVNQAARVYSREADFADGQWTLYTPTYTAFGTVTGSSVWSRRISDTLQVRGRFTSGTATASEARVTLGFNGTNANVISDATKVASIQQAGTFVRSAVGTSSLYTLIESSVGYFTLSLQTGSVASLTKASANGAVGSANDISFLVDVPIAGW